MPDEFDAPQGSDDGGESFDSSVEGNVSQEQEFQDPNDFDSVASGSEEKPSAESHRIAVLTKARRQAERERDDKSAMFETLAAQNRALEKMISTFQHTVDKAQAVDPMQSIDSQIASVRDAHARAIETMDYANAAHLMEQLTDLKVERKMAGFKAEMPRTPTQPQQFNQVAFEQKMMAMNVLQREEQFLSSDRAKKALKIHVEELGEKPEWKNKPPHVVIAEGLKRTKAFMASSGFRVPSVEGASSGQRGMASSGLSQIEKNVARATFRGSGLSDTEAEKAYLMQKNFINGVR